MKTGTLLAGGAAVLALGYVLTTGDGENSSADTSAETQQLLEDLASPVEVVYHVTGSAEHVSLTAETPTGTTQQEASLPLMNKAGDAGLHFTFDPGQFVYIAAQNEGTVGSVTCQIVVDGEVIAENTATADYGIATCKGTS